MTIYNLAEGMHHAYPHCDVLLITHVASQVKPVAYNNHSVNQLHVHEFCKIIVVYITR